MNPALAQQGIHLGTSSWKYKGWLGSIHSADRYARLLVAGSNRGGRQPELPVIFPLELHEEVARDANDRLHLDTGCGWQRRPNGRSPRQSPARGRWIGRWPRRSK